MTSSFLPFDFHLRNKSLPFGPIIVRFSFQMSPVRIDWQSAEIISWSAHEVFFSYFISHGKLCDA